MDRGRGDRDRRVVPDGPDGSDQRQRNPGRGFCDPGGRNVGRIDLVDRKGNRAGDGRFGGAIGSFQPYSPELFASLQKQHKIVLIKFTANWCATCQLIEASVFHDPSVWEELKANNVVALKGDFSQENPTAMELLKSLNPGGGIPLTAIYPAE